MIAKNPITKKTTKLIAGCTNNNKIKSVELFVILDDVEFRKGYFHNRNKIIDNLGKEQWITIPLIKINAKNYKLENF